MNEEAISLFFYTNKFQTVALWHTCLFSLYYKKMMKTNIQKQFTASMDLYCNLELNNEENLKHINTCFIKGFMKQTKLLTENNTQAGLEKSIRVLIGFTVASGNDRAERAIALALLPLLLNNEIPDKSKNVLLQISSHIIEISIVEIGLINDYIQNKMKNKAKITMTVSEDKNLGESLAITIIISDNLKA